MRVSDRGREGERLEYRIGVVKWVEIVMTADLDRCHDLA